MERSLWRPSAAQLWRLLPGLWLFGTGEAFLVHSTLGNSPWTVFAEGVSKQTPVSIGAATVATSVLVMLLWIPLRQRPGPGTLLNAVLIGVAIDVMLPLLPGPGGIVGQTAFVLAGIALVGIGSGLYLTAHLGPGPRDGLMTSPAFSDGALAAAVARADRGQRTGARCGPGRDRGSGNGRLRAARGAGSTGGREGAGWARTLETC